MRMFCGLLAIMISLPAWAVGPDPSQNWQSAETEHFRINYEATQRRQAESIARIAETALARLTDQLHWQPEGRIDLIVLDAYDLANGFSTPLPFNRSAFFLAPPDDGELLDNSNWLELLATHELTHTVHLDKVHGPAAIFRRVFGRFPLLFPNALAPGWTMEGIATYNESHPQSGRGRLHGADFESWLRIQRDQGFIALDEINANGRALPTSKQYLYGAYFYDFLNRRYGADAAYQYINNYSDSLVPHLMSNPKFLTSKMLDALWPEFLAALAQTVDVRAAPLKAKPRADGAPILPAQFRISSLAQYRQGVLAAADDGLHGNRLLYLDTRGETTELAKLRGHARLDARADGTVLIAQPDYCRGYYDYYDLYLWRAESGLARLTECKRYRRAVWLGNEIAALKYEAGTSRVDLLQADANGAHFARTLYAADSPELVVTDLAASSNALRIALVLKQRGQWQVVEVDPNTLQQQVLFDFDRPLQALRYTHDGKNLEFIAEHAGVNNLWRHTRGTARITRLTHTYTGITLHSGTLQDDAFILGVMAQGGTALHRMSKPVTQEEIGLAAPTAPMSASIDGSPVLLGPATDYQAWRSIYPRSWFPLLYADRGLRAYGVSTFGGDALDWHRYTVNAMWETSQHEAMGSMDYAYLDRHFFNLTRNLWAREWTGNAGNEKITLYDRTTDAQWVSLVPYLRQAERFYVGIGAAQQSTDRVQVGGFTTQPQMERVAAAFLQYDTRETDWYASGFNCGHRARLLYESYRPFTGQYDGHIVRLDAQQLFPLGISVFGVHWGEARAFGTTESFQLGGAFAYDSSLTAPQLNQRNLPLRGYRGSETELRGANMHHASLEWQTPLADIDWNGMAPPVGINRLSASLFMDAGSVWNNGDPHSRFYRGVGGELQAETRLLYQVSLPLRIGYAHALDIEAGNRFYFMVGQVF